MSRDQLKIRYSNNHKYVIFRHQLTDLSKANRRSPAATVLQRKASMQQIGQQLKEICILTHCNYSQPASIKLDNENIGGHLTPLQCLPALGRLYD